MWIVEPHENGEWKIRNQSTGEEHYFTTQAEAIAEAKEANELQ